MPGQLKRPRGLIPRQARRRPGLYRPLNVFVYPSVVPERPPCPSQAALGDCAIIDARGALPKDSPPPGWIIDARVVRATHGRPRTRPARRGRHPTPCADAMPPPSGARARALTWASVAREIASVGDGPWRARRNRQTWGADLRS